MRLIDADALCKKIRKIYNGYMLDEGCTPIEFENMVDDMPTAFDTKKVVENLETLHDLVKINQKLAVSQAIDIVKKGGME